MNWINTVLLPIYSQMLQATCLIYGERKEYLSQQFISPKFLGFQTPSSSFSFNCSLPCPCDRPCDSFALCSVAQSCLTLCDPVDCSPPGSSVHGIFPARILEWVAISSSRGSSHPKDQTHGYPFLLTWRWILYWCNDRPYLPEMFNFWNLSAIHQL